MFVDPSLYLSVCRELKDLGLNLTASHVIFDESIEYLVEEALVRSKEHLKTKRTSLSIRTSFSDVATCGTDIDDVSNECMQPGEFPHLPYELKVVHTFICVVPVEEHDTAVT